MNFIKSSITLTIILKILMLLTCKLIFTFTITKTICLCTLAKQKNDLFIKMLPRQKTCCCVILCNFLFALCTYSIAQTLTYTSGPDIYLAKRGSNLVSDSIYISYQFINGAVACDDAWAELESISGLQNKLSLATNEDGFMRIGPLAENATSGVFFYLAFSGSTNNSGSLLTKVYCGNPNDTDSTLLASNVTTINSIQTTQEASPQTHLDVLICDPSATTNSTTLQIGGVCTMTIIGNQGNLPTKNQILYFNPASSDTWLPDTLELFESEIKINCGETNEITLNNTLYYAGNGGTASKSHCGVYKFRLREIYQSSSGLKTNALLFANSGNPIKFTGNFDQPEFTIDLPDTVNSVTLNKSVVDTNGNTHNLTGPMTVTYTITISNPTNTEIFLDDIEDTLPSLPANASYITNSSKLDGISISDPNVVGQVLTWDRVITVPAGTVSVPGTAVLTYEATIPNTQGVYQNSVVAHIGTVVIDTTTDMTDNMPATADYQIGSGKITIQKTALGGTGTFNYTSADTDLDSISLAVVTNGGTTTSTTYTKEPGSYTITEDSQVGWSLADLTCTGDTDNGSIISVDSGQVSIDLDAGENITCNFENTKLLD